MIFKFNYKCTVLFLLVLLLIPITYIGIPLNGGDKGWIYVNGVLREYHAIRVSIVLLPADFSVFDYFVLFSNILLYIAPILIFTKLNKIGAIYIPSAFLILTIIYFPLMVILLIPYILIWVALLVYSKHALEK